MIKYYQTDIPRYKDILRKPTKQWTPIGLLSSKRYALILISNPAGMRTKYLYRMESGQSLEGVNLMTGHEWLLKVMDSKDKSDMNEDNKVIDVEGNLGKDRDYKYTCVHCGKLYKGEKCFFNHLNKCDEAPWRLKGSENNTFLCVNCGISYKGEKCLINHSEKCDEVTCLSKGHKQ